MKRLTIVVYHDAPGNGQDTFEADLLHGVRAAATCLREQSNGGVGPQVLVEVYRGAISSETLYDGLDF